MLVYYNEWEKYPAEWLRNLILTGEIPEGLVDETDIRKINAEEIQKYDVCHFFAGIGGWAKALELAGWDPARPVWTGSCPCQPFSVAGAQKSKEDDRHLWPYFFRLIRERPPPTLFMEQVRGAIAHGWLDEVSRNLEDEGYAVGAAVLPACGVGAPHRRERLWIVADARSARRGERLLRDNNNNGKQTEQRRTTEFTKPSQTSVFVAHPHNEGSQGRHSGELQERSGEQLVRESGSSSNPNGEQARRPSVAREKGSFWELESGLGLLASGVPSRVGRLRAYGNAIVPQVAAQFIRAFLEAEKDL